ncbi:hypothetical protein [Arcanobacterium canis]
MGKRSYTAKPGDKLGGGWFDTSKPGKTCGGGDTHGNDWIGERP